MFGVEASTLIDLGLRHASDEVIFRALREAGHVIATKDDDFVELVTRHGQPPQVLWFTCGNVTNSALQTLLQAAFPKALEMLIAGEPVVEIGR